MKQILLWSFLFLTLIVMADQIQGWRRRRRRRCFRNCAVSSWSPWSSCSQPCGTGGTQRRLRWVTRGALCGGSCPYQLAQTRYCNMRCSNGGTPVPGRCNCKTGYSGHCCTGVDGGWSTWSPWNTCSKVCGTGVQERRRDCTKPSPSNGGRPCVGASRQDRACNTHICPVDGGWSTWTSWITCSQVCGTGVQVRRRDCTKPSPSNGGRACVGESQQDRACNTHICPGDRQQKIISAPDKPTRVFIGDNVSLTWQYYQPNHFKLFEVVFGIWKSPGLTTRLVAVNASGFPDVRKGYESKYGWAGNLTSSLAVFVLYHVKLADGKKLFGIHVEYDLYNQLTDGPVQLQVVAKHRPNITYVTTPPLLRIGQNVSLNCTASGLSPVNVTWYKGHKVLASGISEAAFTLKNITDKDWGEFVCVAKNSVGEDKESVKILPESPTALTTKRFSISTDFPDRNSKNTDQTTILLHTETQTSVTPSSSNKKKGVSTSKTEVIYSVVAAIAVFLVVVAIYFIRRKRIRNKIKEHNKEQQGQRGITLCSENLTFEADLTFEATQETANERTTGECLVLTSLGHEMNVTTPGGSTSNELLRTFVPLRGSERSEHNEDIQMSDIKRSTPVEENKISMETNEALQRVNNSEDYLQQVDDDNLQAAVKSTDNSRLCRGKAKTLSTTDCPQPRPRVKREKLFQCKHSTFTGPLLSLQFTDLLQENPLYQRETAAAQHCASVNPANQSNRLIPQTRTHDGQHNYQNDRCTTTTYQNASNQSRSPLRPACSGETPYARVNLNTNWEVSRDRLSLIERIGGGSFGQVWKGAVLDVAGAKGWSAVAVKMLKENSSKSDLKDLLSELDLLKKLKPHPNVIQLLGCLTKDVMRCKGRPDFKPPLVILEFVPHGDLLGYLRKSTGATDDYYNLRSDEVPQKIPIQQLYKFASDIARGMEFISAHQLIHRDLAARNVLVGEGLRCKITDFGMARDLRKAEIYVMRSNGVVPVKWLAIESLKQCVFTTESDVWSYGIVLYEIFTLGGKPYEGMTSEEVLHYVETGGRLSRTSSMSSELYNVMLKCWQENPSKRPTFRSIASWMETVAYDH